MKKSLIIMVSILGLIGLLMTSCFNPLGGDDFSGGSIRISVAPPGDDTSRGLTSTRDISDSVDSLVVKLMHSEYTDLYGEAAWDDTNGAEVEFFNVKQGDWNVEVFLNDSGNDTLYYGEGEVECFPGTSNTVPITIYPTGEILIQIEEGNLLAPAEIVPDYDSIDWANQTIDVTIYSGTGSLKRAIGSAPESGDALQTSPHAITIGFDDVLYAEAIDLTSTETAVVTTYSYGLPYTMPEPSGTFTGYTWITLRTNQEGYTIRYTIDGSQPTYEHGIVAGNYSKILLTDATTTIQMVTYKAGFPETVSAMRWSEYTLNLFSSINPDIDGSVIADGDTYSGFGTIAPSDSETRTLTIENVGEGLDLEVTNITVGLPFSVDSTTMDIPAGEETQVVLTFDPEGSSGDYTETLTIASNSSTPADSDIFTISLSASANNPPTLSLLNGVEVSYAGVSGVNGRYEQVADVYGNDCFQHISGNYYIFYDYIWTNPYYWGSNYFIGTDTEVDPSTDTSTFIYRKAYGTTNNHLGESYSHQSDNSTDSWVSTGYYSGAGNSPYVATITGGIGGWANRLNDTSFRPLNAYYDYEDDESDASASISFQWYSADSETGTGTAISGATSESYTPSGGVGTGDWVYVKMIPHAATGVADGSEYESGRIQLTNN